MRSHMKLIRTFILAMLMFSCFDERNASTRDDGLTSAIEPVSIGDTASISIDVIATNLDVPWEIVWGPDNWIWYTEKGGSISKVNPLTGERKLLLHMPEVLRSGTKGL